MTFNLEVPLSDRRLDIPVELGEVLFVVGANGVGKSSLMSRFAQYLGNTSKWLSAHRQTWINSNQINMTAAQRTENEKHVERSTAREQARWEDSFSQTITMNSMFDLLAKESVLDRKIATAARAEDGDKLAELISKATPRQMLNQLLRRSNMPIEISISDTEQVMASKENSEPFSIQHLSDGERNVLIVAMSVLTADAGTIFLLDEPERHLHHSIILPLLNALFEQRADCAFVISTHDVSLPTKATSASTLLVRKCIYDNNQLIAWDADYLASAETIDDETALSILGSRRQIIFIEGLSSSLDKPLYSLIFGQVSIVPKSSCRNVEQTVSAIRAADDLHWIQAWGIVDNDRRPEDEIESLKVKGVYALSVYSVESIYYHPAVILKVAQRHADTTGDNVDELLSTATERALYSIQQHRERMINRTAEREIRRQFFSKIPTSREISEGMASITVNINVDGALAEEGERFDRLMENQDLGALIDNYPVRETSALSDIASNIGFKNRAQYQRAVLKLLEEDEEALGLVKSLFGDLIDEIETV